MCIWKIALAGAAAGAVSGLFGAGGGMVLVPLLIFLTDLEDIEIFPASIAIMFPLCIVSLIAYSFQAPLPFTEALPYMLGSAIGGIPAGLFGKKIPRVWLHRILGILILWGGWRFLC